MYRATANLTTRFLHERRNGKRTRPYYIRKVPVWLQPIVGIKAWWIALPFDPEAARREAARLARNHDKLTSPDIRRLVVREHGTGTQRAPERVHRVRDPKTGAIREELEPRAIPKVLDMLMAMAMPPIDVADVPDDLLTWPVDQARGFMAFRALAKADNESTAADAARLAPLVEALEDTDTTPGTATLSEVLHDWLRDPTKRRAPGTELKYAMVVRRLGEAFGDPPVTTITPNAVWQFRNTIAALPRQAGLPASLRKASLSQLADWKSKHPTHPTVLPSVVDIHLTVLRSAMAWFIRRNPDAMVRNPAADIERIDDPRGNDGYHLAALPWQELPAFMVELLGHDRQAARCLAFVILTAARTEEARSAVWVEIDLGKRVWTIPATRMKTRKEHVVPLAESAIELLGTPSPGRVFPSLGADALRDFLTRHMGRRDATVHGFRSTFRDWIAEKTMHDPIAAELALAHAVGSKVEAAYRRGSMFEKRRALMEDWAAFCLSGRG